MENHKSINQTDLAAFVASPAPGPSMLRDKMLDSIARTQTFALLTVHRILAASLFTIVGKIHHTHSHQHKNSTTKKKNRQLGGSEKKEFHTSCLRIHFFQSNLVSHLRKTSSFLTSKLCCSGTSSVLCDIQKGIAQS
jgi:hypothetical protein